MLKEEGKERKGTERGEVPGSLLSRLSNSTGPVANHPQFFFLFFEGKK